VEDNVGDVHPGRLTISWVCNGIAKVQAAGVFALVAIQGIIVHVYHLFIISVFIKLFNMSSSFLFLSFVHQELDGVLPDDEEQAQDCNRVQGQWEISVDYSPGVTVFQSLLIFIIW